MMDPNQFLTCDYLFSKTKNWIHEEIKVVLSYGLFHKKIICDENTHLYFPIGNTQIGKIIQTQMGGYKCFP